MFNRIVETFFFREKYIKIKDWNVYYCFYLLILMEGEIKNVFSTALLPLKLSQFFNTTLVFVTFWSSKVKSRGAKATTTSYYLKQAKTVVVVLVL